MGNVRYDHVVLDGNDLLFSFHLVFIFKKPVMEPHTSKAESTQFITPFFASDSVLFGFFKRLTDLAVIMGRWRF